MVKLILNNKELGWLKKIVNLIDIKLVVNLISGDNNDPTKKEIIKLIKKIEKL